MTLSFNLATANTCNDYLSSNESDLSWSDFFDLSHLQGFYNTGYGRDFTSVLAVSQNGDVRVFDVSPKKSSGIPLSQRTFSNIKIGNGEQVIASYHGIRKGGGTSDLVTVVTKSVDYHVRVYSADSASMNRADVSLGRFFTSVKIGVGETVLGTNYLKGEGAGSRDLVSIITLDKSGRVRAYGAEANNVKQQTSEKDRRYSTPRLFSNMEIGSGQKVIGTYYGQSQGGGGSPLLAAITLDATDGQVYLYKADGASANRNEVSKGSPLGTIQLGSEEVVIGSYYGIGEGNGSSTLVTIITITPDGKIQSYGMSTNHESFGRLVQPTEYAALNF